MIRSFAHKGLELFFTTGSTRGIQASHAKRLRAILQLLDGAQLPGDMNFVGSGLHMLKGDLAGLWSVRVSGNWRIIYRFEDGDAWIVNYLDYH